MRHQARMSIIQSTKLPTAQVMPSAEMTDIRICHRLPTRNGTQPIIAKFVRREVKSAIIPDKAVMKETSMVYRDDHITPLRSDLSKVLRDRRDAKYENFLNEKITLL